MSDSAHSRIRPPALRSGDTVGIVAPGSNIRPDLLQAGCRELQRLGYKTFYLDSIFDHDLYFSGSVKRRAGELQEMFEREEVRASSALGAGTAVITCWRNSISVKFSAIRRFSSATAT